MSYWAVEVFSKKPDGTESWGLLHPKGAPPYQFLTEDQAYDAMRLCYGDPAHSAHARVSLVLEDKDVVVSEAPGGAQPGDAQTA